MVLLFCSPLTVLSTVFKLIILRKYIHTSQTICKMKSHFKHTKKKKPCLYPVPPISCSIVNKKTIRSSLPEVFLWKYVLKVCSKYAGEHPWWSLISISSYATLLNHTSSWVFSCKFVVYFQNTLSWEHLLRAASEPFLFQVTGNLQLLWWLGLLVFASKCVIYSHIFSRPWYRIYE